MAKPDNPQSGCRGCDDRQPRLSPNAPPEFISPNCPVHGWDDTDEMRAIREWAADYFGDLGVAPDELRAIIAPSPGPDCSHAKCRPWGACQFGGARNG